MHTETERAEPEEVAGRAAEYRVRGRVELVVAASAEVAIRSHVHFHGLMSKLFNSQTNTLWLPASARTSATA
jgi:hypothetical protein